ncbi:MAG: hypothetical protein VKO39_11830 [Cyanobacteriota bacterium]|nr:hypothetical protein [Cyanobacteriota bacterium]
MSEHPSMLSTARRLGRQSHPSTHRATCPWAASALLTGVAMALGLQAGPARAEVLYSLETKCALGGAAAVACRVEAMNEEGATLYRHTIGPTTHTLRISDDPARFTLWDASSKTWNPLRNAAVRFSTNTLCLNDQELCVVNPNYLNSLLQERPDFRGRDLVRVHFAANGRVDIICYDTGCDLLAQKREAQ